jgi:signal transduction histidine kinase
MPKPAKDSRTAYVEALEELELLFTHARAPSEEASKTIVTARQRAASVIEAGGGNPEAIRSGLVLFAASVLNGLWLERDWDNNDLETLLGGIADLSGQPVEFVAVAVALRTLNDPAVLELPPAVAVEAQMGMLSTFGPLRSVSLWICGPGNRPRVLINRGPAPPSRRMRELARQALRGDEATPGVLQAVPVLRWQEPHAALVARAAANARHQCLACLRESARMLGPLLERQALLERSAARERWLVSASERLLTRLGLDLHDGPLQDAAALSRDLALFRRQLANVLSDHPGREPLLGRVDDFEAQLAALDSSVRNVVRSLDVPGLARRPFRDTLERDAEAFRERSDIDLRVDLSGDFDLLTPSQRIALLRIMQEGLSNIRQHSGATKARISASVHAGHVRARIHDNGGGFVTSRTFAEANRSGRMGLAGMLERVRLLGGRIDISSRPGGPTTISVVLPRVEPGLLGAYGDPSDGGNPLAAAG